MADRTVTYRFLGDIGDLRGKITAAGASVKNFGTELTALDKKGEEMRAGLTTVGSAATKFGLVVAGGLAFAGKAAMDWETAWTGVLKTVDGTPAQLAKLEDGLRNLAKETGFAHAEVAAVAEAAGQLGISTEGVEEFTKTMLDMGVSTILSSEEAATGLARLRNIMGTTEGEIRNTGSAMVELGNNFATTEGEILAMSLRIAGAGRQAGLTTADILGLSTAMSSVGIEAEAGGTAMSLTMKRIGKEVDQGGEKLALFAQVAGMTEQQFSQAWGENAAGALTKFVAGLSNTEAIGMSTNAVLSELGIKGIREADALLRLSGNAQGLADALGVANQGFAENNALAEEAGKFYGTSAQQMKQAWAMIKDSAIDAGAAILPVIVKLVEGIAELAGVWQELPGNVQMAIVGFAAFVAVGGLAIGALSRVVISIAAAKVAMGQLGVGVGGASAAVRTLGADLAILATTSMTAGAQTQREMDRSAASAARLRTTLGRVGRAVGPLAGIALASSGVGDSFAFTNTAAYALMGTIAGPWGAAIGGGIGLLMDYKKSADQAALSTEAFDAALKGFGPGAVIAEVTELEAKTAELQDQFDFIDLSGPAGEMADMKAELQGLMDITPRAGQALQALGISVEDFLAMDSTDKLLTTWAIEDWVKTSGTAKGATKDLEKAFDEFSEGALDAADAVDFLESALNALLNPAIAAEKANLELLAAQRNLKDSLHETSRSLNANSDAGRKNREALVDIMLATQDSVIADARLYESRGQLAEKQDELSTKLLENQEAFIKNATAAGFNAKEIEALAEEIGYTEDEFREVIAAMTTADNTKVDPDVDIDTAGPTRKVNKFQEELDALSGMTATPSVYVNGLGAALSNVALVRSSLSSLSAFSSSLKVGVGGIFGRSADGGTVPKTGMAYADRHPYLLADGEEVISNRHGQADKNRFELKAANRGAKLQIAGYADGGTIEANRQIRSQASSYSPVRTSTASAQPSSVSLDGLSITGTFEIGGDGLGRIIDGRIHQQGAGMQAQVRRGGS